MTSKAHTHTNEVVSKRLSVPPTVKSPADTAHGQARPSATIRKARIDPTSLTPREVLQLQSTVGNKAVGQLLSKASRPPQQAQIRNIVPSDGTVIQRKIMKADELAKNGAYYYFFFNSVLYKARLVGEDNGNLKFETEGKEEILLPGTGKAWREVHLPEFSDNPDELQRRTAILETMNEIRVVTSHSGEVPELSKERKELYSAIQKGSLENVKEALTKTKISCREGAFIIALLASNKKSVVGEIIGEMLTKVIGRDDLEDFLWKQMNSEPYTGEPQIGAVIHILGTTHTVLYVGNGEVVSLNNEEHFQVRRLTDEINLLLASSPAPVKMMLSSWYGNMREEMVEEVFGKRHDDFFDYIHSDEESEEKNKMYIKDFKIGNPKVSCTVSESLAEVLF